MGTETHAGILQAWIAHCFWGRPVTKLTALAGIPDNCLQVEAIVHPGVGRGTAAEIRRVILYYCISKAERFSDAKDRYVAQTMVRVPAANLWRAKVDIPENVAGPIFWYVEAVDWTQGLEGRATTLLETVSAN